MTDIASRLRDRAKWFDEIKFGQEIALINEAADEIDRLRDAEVNAQAILAKVRKVRDGYADQAKFADVDQASYFREFVRRLDEACMGEKK